MMNIGQSPTVAAKSQRLEVHIFDFNQDIYEHTIKVFLKERVRDEVHFENLDFLKEQLQKDKNQILSR